MTPTVICGTDRLSAKQRFDEICEEFRKKGFQVKKIEGDTLEDIQSVFNEFKASPLFSGLTAIAILYLSQNPNIDIQKAILSMAKESERPVIFFEPEEEGKENKVIEDAKSFLWRLIRFEKPDKNAIPRWILEKAKKQGISISINWAKRLAEMLNYQPEMVYQTLEKISVFTNSIDHRTWPIIKNLVWSEHETNVWKLIDALMRGSRSKIKMALPPPTLDDGSLMQILYTLYSQYRKLLIFQSCLKEGMSILKSAEIAGISQFAIVQFQSASKRMNFSKTVKTLEKIVELEELVKTGEIYPYTALIETVTMIIESK